MKMNKEDILKKLNVETIEELEPNKETLIALYHDLGLNSYDIASLFNTSSPTIIRRLDYYNIPKRGIGRRLKELRPSNDVIEIFNAKDKK